MTTEIRKISISNESISAIFIVIFMALFILVNLTYGFVWSLFILAVAVGFLIAVYSPQSGLLAIIPLTMLFERFFTLQSFYLGRVEYKIYPLDFILAGIILGIIFRILFQKINPAPSYAVSNSRQARISSGRCGIKFELHKADWILIGFIILNFIYFAFSVFILKSDFALSFSTLKNYAFYGLLYFITAILIKDQADLKRIFRFFLAGAIGIIIFIFIGIFRGEGLWTEFTPLSTSGFRILAFTHGLYLTLALIPILLIIAFKESRFQKFLYLISAVWIIGIVGSLMRHLWVSLFLAFILVLFLAGKKYAGNILKTALNFVPVLLIAVLVIIYLSAIFPTSKINYFASGVASVVTQRAQSIESFNEDESFFWRSIVWQSAYEELKNNPFLGIGTGKTIYAETETYKDFIEARNIHNSYLSILLQFGLLGLLGFLYFVYLNVKNLLKNINFTSLSLAGIISLFLIAFLFQPYLETNMLAILFWISLGLTRNLSKFKPI
ncbi:MAG: O-antigen ligase family protein [Candidatus Moranbacteria bacterium]|nr:O-antigen ligase family protein [Candidatus Moranbacteria bacterium]